MTTKEAILKLSAQGMEPAKIARRVHCAASYVYNVIASEKKNPDTSDSTIDPLKHWQDQAATESQQDKLKSDLLARLYGTVDYTTFLRVGVVLQSIQEERL